MPRAGLGGPIGEPAPPLVVQEWINGKPVEIKAGTNIFVVEIWHASSPAKFAIITNLNDIQKRFKTNGVVVVGISDEPAEKIKANIQHDGTNIMNIEFAIAADNQRKTSLGYMRPLGPAGIPCAFVVGTNGNLLWHGPPQLGLIPASLTTLAHFCISSVMNLPKSDGEPTSIMAPRLANRAFILASARPALISLLSLSMISTGAFLGRPMPHQKLAS